MPMIEDGEEQEPRNTGIGSDRVILHGVERTGSGREYIIDQGHPTIASIPLTHCPGGWLVSPSMNGTT